MSNQPVTDPPVRRNFGASIRQLRTARGLTQAELADVLGCAQTTVAGWENDQSHPRRDRMRPLADALGVHLATLFSEYVR